MKKLMLIPVLAFIVGAAWAVAAEFAKTQTVAAPTHYALDEESTICWPCLDTEPEQICSEEETTEVCTCEVPPSTENQGPGTPGASLPAFESQNCVLLYRQNSN